MDRIRLEHSRPSWVEGMDTALTAAGYGHPARHPEQPLWIRRAGFHFPPGINSLADYLAAVSRHYDMLTCSGVAIARCEYYVEASSSSDADPMLYVAAEHVEGETVNDNAATFMLPIEARRALSGLAVGLDRYHHKIFRGEQHMLWDITRLGQYMCEKGTGRLRLVDMLPSLDAAARHMSCERRDLGRWAGTLVTLRDVGRYY